MFTVPQITTAKEIQKDYRKIFDRVKETKQPVLVMRNNQPDVAIVDVESLQKMEATIAVLKSRAEADAGQAAPLPGSLTDLWYEANTD